ncbi:menaquinone biosynthesis protein [bacterium]|jgi:chorismate dehydratase|nr:menaquinone biosynthesis protein [Verrucomicrobiota bacterium]MDA7497348.1 menaquinone biosynthesis protein [bacterium]MDA7632935.1 menaquinone biosynthesis protein [bacterium]MDA7645258.1 menaquinone biosynthesis protein [bacterium]MDA7657250.1 menaquinone biosynthesis protein [Verrucomicrobiota bacterium]
MRSPIEFNYDGPRPSIPRGIRIGSVPYLNAVPLTWGLEREIVFLPPSELGLAIREGELDVALLSITQVLFEDRYRIIDGMGVCSRGPVRSVFLAHSDPLEEVKEVFCDPASLTSVNLLRVLLHRRGIHPNWRMLDSYDSAPDHRNVLLIGNPAIRFRSPRSRHTIWDLGKAWDEEMHLPFVYAVWVVRKEITDAKLFAKLRKAKDKGLEDLDRIVTNYPEFDGPFRQKYLTQNIHYHIGEDEKRGIDRFTHELRHFPDLKVYDPEFIASM